VADFARVHTCVQNWLVLIFMFVLIKIKKEQM